MPGTSEYWAEDYVLSLFMGRFGSVDPFPDAAFVVIGWAQARRVSGMRRVADQRDDLINTPAAAEGGTRWIGNGSVGAEQLTSEVATLCSQVVVALPVESSRLLTRELLYTAVTRASNKVTLVGDEAVIRHAITRSVERASGLGVRLWGSGT